MFWEVGNTKVNEGNLMVANTISGRRSQHQVRSASYTITLIQYYNFLCHCIGCLGGFPNIPCQHKSHVTDWNLVRLSIRDMVSARAIMGEGDNEIWWGTYGEDVEDHACVGENVAIPCQGAMEHCVRTQLICFTLQLGMYSNKHYCDFQNSLITCTLQI